MSSLEARLRAEIETLRETVRQLEDMIAPSLLPPVEWGLKRQEALLFSMLTTRDIVHRESALMMLCRNADGATMNLVSVIMWGLRQKTAEHGVVIETVKCVGYKLHDRQRWAEVLS